VARYEDSFASQFSFKAFCQNNPKHHQIERLSSKLAPLEAGANLLFSSIAILNL
jgi:hypothetical protein